MYASGNFSGAVLDIGFLGKPLSDRLFPSMVVHVHNSRRRQGLIQRTLGPVLSSIWKCFL